VFPGTPSKTLELLGRISEAQRMHSTKSSRASRALIHVVITVCPRTPHRISPVFLYGCVLSSIQNTPLHRVLNKTTVHYLPPNYSPSLSHTKIQAATTKKHSLSTNLEKQSYLLHYALLPAPASHLQYTLWPLILTPRFPLFQLHHTVCSAISACQLRYITLFIRLLLCTQTHTHPNQTPTFPTHTS
jgi:hypothetical protein